MMRYIFLLSGKAQAGKDTFGSMARDFGFHRYAFADALKREAIDGGWDSQKDERGRTLLQDLGSVWRRYEPDHWIRRLQESIDHYRVVVTDCRYQNEIVLMREWGELHGYRVLTIRIERPGYDSLSLDMASHSSECDLDKFPFDHYICNIGTLEEYCEKCKKIVREILRDHTLREITG